MTNKLNNLFMFISLIILFNKELAAQDSNSTSTTADEQSSITSAEENSPVKNSAVVKGKKLSTIRGKKLSTKVIMQEQAPTKEISLKDAQEKQNLKVYIDDKKNIYWPMDLPFWIKLANTPEDGGETFLLQKIEMFSSKENEKQIKEGIHLEIPGQQFIRWVNFVSKDELKYKFFADGAPPSVILKLTNAPKHGTNDRIFFGVGLNAELIAQDDQSGVFRSYLALNDKDFVPFDKKIDLPEENLYQLKYYAVDNVGYISATATETFQVDTTSPGSNIHAINNFKETILSRQTKLVLESSDALAGVQAIYYKFDLSPAFTVYSGSSGIPLEALNDGSHVINFYAMDNVNNREEPQKFTFYLDRTPPVVAYTFIGDHYSVQKKHYISARTRIKIDANDSQVNVKEIIYKINNGSDTQYLSAFNPPIKSGDFNLGYSATDELGNASESASIELVMDTDSPKSNYEITAPSFVKESGVTYITNQSVIKLASSDALAGVKEINYQINDQPPENYTAPIALTKDGRYLLRYWATDQVNNQETISPMLIIVDNVGPEIVDIYSLDAISSNSTSDGKKWNAYPLGTAMTLNGIDSSSGVERVNYSLNDEAIKEYKGPIVFSKAGKYKIFINAKDKLGNITTKTNYIEVLDKSWKRGEN